MNTTKAMSPCLLTQRVRWVGLWLFSLKMRGDPELGVPANASSSRCPLWSFFDGPEHHRQKALPLVSASATAVDHSFPLSHPTHTMVKQPRRHKIVLMKWDCLYKKRRKEELLVDFLRWRVGRLESQMYGKRSLWVTVLKGTKGRDSVLQVSLESRGSGKGIAEGEYLTNFVHDDPG